LGRIGFGEQILEQLANEPEKAWLAHAWRLETVLAAGSG